MKDNRLRELLEQQKEKEIQAIRSINSKLRKGEKIRINYISY